MTGICLGSLSKNGADSRCTMINHCLYVSFYNLAAALSQHCCLEKNCLGKKSATHLDKKYGSEKALSRKDCWWTFDSDRKNAICLPIMILLYTKVLRKSSQNAYCVFFQSGGVCVSGSNTSLSCFGCLPLSHHNFSA